MCKDKAQSDPNNCKILKNNVAPLIGEHKANAATDEVHIENQNCGLAWSESGICGRKLSSYKIQKELHNIKTLCSTLKTGSMCTKKWRVSVVKDNSPYLLAGVASSLICNSFF